MGVEWESKLTFGFVAQRIGVDERKTPAKAETASKSPGHLQLSSRLISAMSSLLQRKCTSDLRLNGFIYRGLQSLLESKMGSSRPLDVRDATSCPQRAWALSPKLGKPCDTRNELSNG
jgi:hypothetical protein